MAVGFSILNGGVSASAATVDCPIVLVAAPNRRLLAVVGARGNSGQTTLTVELRTSGGGSLVETFTSVLQQDQDSGTVVVGQFNILEADLPADAAYTVRVSTPGAFQVGCAVCLLNTVEQTASLPAAQTDTDFGNGTSLSTSITAATGDGRTIDAWAGDGGNDWAPNIGELRAEWTGTMSPGTFDLDSAQSGPASGARTYGWSGSFNNRNVLATVWYDEFSGGGGSAENAVMHGANF